MRQRKTYEPQKEEQEFEDYQESPKKDVKQPYRNSPLVYLKAGPKKSRYQNNQNKK